MFSHFFLILLLISYTTRPISGQELTFNSKQNYHPLIVAESISTEKELYGQATTISATSNKEGIKFTLPEETKSKYRMLSACPAENVDDENFNDKIMKKYNFINMVLFENKGSESTNIYCDNPLVPSIIADKADIKCGNAGSGYYYHVGYWKSEFITIYEICKNSNNKSETSKSSRVPVIFTKHTLQPGQHEENKTPPEEFEKLKFYMTFKQNESQLLSKKFNENIHQFVPFDDMIPIPWKTSTLFDINTINVSSHIKRHLDDIDEFLRYFSTSVILSFNLYSGVKNILTEEGEITVNSNSYLFWKVVEKGNAGIALMLYDQPPGTCSLPCKNGDEICRHIGLQKLKTFIPCFFCCPVNEVVEDLGIISQNEKTEIVALNLPEILNFRAMFEDFQFQILVHDDLKDPI